MSRHRETDFALGMINQWNLWNAIQSEEWIINAEPAETPEEYMEDTIVLMKCKAIFASAHEYPGAGEA